MQQEREIAIGAPAAKVFDYVADFTRHKEWGKHIVDMKADSAGALGVGSRFTHQAKQLGSHSDRVTVTEYAPPSRIAFESEGDAGHIRHWFQVRDEGDKAVLSKGFQSITLKGAAKVLAPFIQMTLAKSLDKDLRGIKAGLEGSS